MSSTPAEEAPPSTAPAVTRDATITSGKILAYRVLEAGDTISLEQAEKLVPSARRLVFGGPLAEGLVIANRPVEIDIGETEISLAGMETALCAPVTAHLFDFGVVTFLYEFPIAAGTKLSALTSLCDALYDSPELDMNARARFDDLMLTLRPCVEKPHASIAPESYTVIFLQAFEGATMEEIAKGEITAKLLLGETSEKPLSSSAREELLRNSFSYLADDLVIVDWNSALVIEPSGSRLVPHILELATSQLLEFRFYDSLLDKELERVYALVEKRRQRILRSPYARLTRSVLQRFMELTEFTERVDNAIKSVGDVYLARVYSAAIKRFRVPEWRENVESKLSLVGRAYELLKGDVEYTRSQLLEVIVVVLILAELVQAIHWSR